MMHNDMMRIYGIGRRPFGFYGRRPYGFGYPFGLGLPLGFLGGLAAGALIRPPYYPPYPPYPFYGYY